MNDVTKANGIGRLHHAGISSPNVERLATFYCDLFGFRETFRKSWGPGQGADEVLGLTRSAAKMIVVESDHATLELFEFSEPPTDAPDPDRPVSAGGINHLCFEVTDLDSEMRRLSAAGMRFHSAPRDVGDGPFTYGRDPDGNIVELWQVEEQTEAI